MRLNPQTKIETYGVLTDTRCRVQDQRAELHDSQNFYAHHFGVQPYSSGLEDAQTVFQPLLSERVPSVHNFILAQKCLGGEKTPFERRTSPSSPG